MPLIGQYHTRRSPSFIFPGPFDPDFNIDYVSQAVREPDDHSVTRAGQSSGDLVVAEAPVTSALRSDGTDVWGEIVPSTEMQLEHSSGISRMLQKDESSRSLSTTQSSRASSTQVSSMDWRRYLNFFPSMHSSSRDSTTASPSPRHPSIGSHTTASHGAFSPERVFQATHRERDSQSMTPQQRNGRATFLTIDGTDPDDIMLPLQMLRSSYMEFLRLDLCYRSISERRFKGGYTLDHLFSTLHSDLLSLEMEELICQGYELSAQAIRHRQAANQIPSNRTSSLLTSEDNHGREAPKGVCQAIEDKDSETRLILKPTSVLMSQMSMGRLVIGLSAPPRDSQDLKHSDVSCVINISFIPERQQPTMGLSAVFERHSTASQVCCIPPRLRTFNVIPDDSQVIQCMMRNDILGVRWVFMKGKASLLDVDSGGFSLLSISILVVAYEIADTIM